LSKGSILVFNVPVKSVGSWGIIVTLCLTLWRPNYDIFSSSKIIVPGLLSSLLANYNILSNPSVKVDFPQPVLPTTPIFERAVTSNLRFFKTKGS